MSNSSNRKQDNQSETTNFRKLTSIKWEHVDLTEEALDFVPPILHQNGVKVGQSKESKEVLRSQGVNIRDGSWTQEEDAVLLKNWRNFVKTADIKDPMLLLGVNRNIDGNSRYVLRKFVSAKKMLVRLGKGLSNRTLYSIYLRARIILNPSRNSGRLTSDEVKKLMKLVTKYGCDFPKIGALMNKTASTCREAYRWRANNSKHGQWSAEEDLALKNAVKKFGLKGKAAVFPWKKIAACVPGRNDSQCRIHWFQKLCKKIGMKWTKQNDACLIYWMHVDLTKHKDGVDWHSLYEKFHKHAASYVTVQRRWLRLKMCVPRCKRQHEYVVKYLYKHYLPVLLKELGLSMKCLEMLANGELVTQNVHKGTVSENGSPDQLNSPADIVSHLAINSSPFSSHGSQPNWWKSVETVSVTVGHQNIEPTYLDSVVKHFVPYKFRLFVTVLHVEPQADSVIKLIRLYCPKCHYLSEDGKPDLEVYQIRNKIPLYLCAACSSDDVEGSECVKQVLEYTFVTSFTLSDGTSTIEAYMWKKNAATFFKGMKPEDVLSDSSKADAINQMLWDICPNCCPFESTNRTSSFASNNKNGSYYPVLDCCIMSYTAAGKTRYQIFDTRLK